MDSLKTLVAAMANAYLVKNVPLTTSEAVNILRNPPSDSHCVSTAPLNVQGGEVYVFKPSTADKEGILRLYIKL